MLTATCLGLSSSLKWHISAKMIGGAKVRAEGSQDQQKLQPRVSKTTVRSFIFVQIWRLIKLTSSMSFGMSAKVCFGWSTILPKRGYLVNLINLQTWMNINEFAVAGMSPKALAWLLRRSTKRQCWPRPCTRGRERRCSGFFGWPCASHVGGQKCWRWSTGPTVFFG